MIKCPNERQRSKSGTSRDDTIIHDLAVKFKETVRIVFISHSAIKITEANKITKHSKKSVNFMEILVMKKKPWPFLNLKSNYVKYMWNTTAPCVQVVIKYADMRDKYVDIK